MNPQVHGVWGRVWTRPSFPVSALRVRHPAPPPLRVCSTVARRITARKTVYVCWMIVREPLTRHRAGGFMACFPSRQPAPFWRLAASSPSRCCSAELAAREFDLLRFGWQKRVLIQNESLICRDTGIETQQYVRYTVPEETPKEGNETSKRENAGFAGDPGILGAETTKPAGLGRVRSGIIQPAYPLPHNGPRVKRYFSLRFKLQKKIPNPLTHIREPSPYPCAYGFARVRFPPQIPVAWALWLKADPASYRVPGRLFCA